MANNLHIAPINWSPRFETGVAELDDDHRHLVGLLNCLADAVGKSCRQSTLEILARIETFVLEHFAREEVLIDRYASEQAAQHREEHRQIHREVALQLEDLYAADYSLNSVATFLHAWLIRHITGSDLHLGKIIVAARAAQASPEACAA